MTIAPISRSTRRPRAWAPADAPLLARYEVDASATGCGTLSAASVDPDLSGWVKVNLDSVIPIGGGLYQLLSAEDAEPLAHGVTELIVNGVAGVFTVEIEIAAWAGQCDSVGVSSGPCIWWIDLLTGEVHDATNPAFGTSVWARAWSNGAGGWILRVTGYQPTALTALTLTMLHGGAEFAGIGEDSADLGLVFGGGVKQIRAPQISDLVGTYPLTGAAGSRPQLYSWAADAWYGEEGYEGGWWGQGQCFASSAALGAAFAWEDAPVIAWGDGRVVVLSGVPNCGFWRVGGASCTHFLRIPSATGGAQGYRRGDSGDFVAPATGGTVASGERLTWRDSFDGATRRVRIDAGEEAAQAQDVAGFTANTLAWGGSSAFGLQHGEAHAFAVARNAGGEEVGVAANGYHDRRMREWLAARYPHALVSLPASPTPHVGVETSVTLSVPVGWYWALSIGGVAVASGYGTGEAEAVAFTPPAAGWKLLRVALLDGAGTEHGADARLVEVAE